MGMRINPSREHKAAGGIHYFSARQLQIQADPGYYPILNQDVRSIRVCSRDDRAILDYFGHLDHLRF
ncbi:hypothetical protein D3C80_1974810 [compost metagenome]